MLVSSSSCLKCSFFFLASASTCSLNNFSFSSLSSSEADSQRWSFRRLRRVSDHVASEERTWKINITCVWVITHLYLSNSNSSSFMGRIKTLQRNLPYQTLVLWNAGWLLLVCAALSPGQSPWSVLIGLSAPPAPSLWDWPRCEPAAPTPVPSQCPHSVGDNIYGSLWQCWQQRKLLLNGINNITILLAKEIPNEGLWCFSLN